MDGVKKLKLKNSLLAVLRIIIILLTVAIFIPGINPSRISGLVNKNLSYFTSSFAYASLADGFKRAVFKEWVNQKSIYILYFSSMISCLGIIACSIGGCLTMGEIRMKRLSMKIIFLGSMIGAAGFTGITYAHYIFTLSSKLDKVEPELPNGFYLFLILILTCTVLSLVLYFLVGKPADKDKMVMQPKYYLFLLFLPFIALSFIFAYLPLWGWRYAFFNYKAGFELTKENFVGFQWFTILLKNAATRSDIVRVLKNTLAMSGLGITTSWLSMAFAIFLSEIKATKYRKFIQTFTTIPNFISWVLVYAFAFALFSTDGLINQLLLQLGVIKEGINFLLGSEHIWLKMLAWGIWKGLGWGAIIYLAAISGIDQQLYEAATVDGAGRFKRMWYITVPGLLPTYFVLLMLSIAGILNNGMDQYLVFRNSANKQTIEVLDLYVYVLGFGGSGGTANSIPLATAIGMLKSLVSVILLFFANGLSKFVRKESII